MEKITMKTIEIILYVSTTKKKKNCWNCKFPLYECLLAGSKIVFHQEVFWSVYFQYEVVYWYLSILCKPSTKF